MIGGRQPSFDLEELIGQPADEARRRCEDDGFVVELFDLDQAPAARLDYNPRRIRLLTRRGRVEDAHCA
jgi:hypothetical protein